jgi:hypothetical protein
LDIVATVENAGILKLKRYHTANIKMEFKHPQYYKNLRKLYRSRNRDQAISLRAQDAERERAPGTGLKRQAPSTKLQATSKPEPVQVQIASSAKRQASQPE